MRWTAPPERREIVLILFSVTCYLLAYNVETSLNYVGIDPVAAQGALFRRIGLGKTKLLGRDGRKPAGWRDKLELTIFGSWDWDVGHVAGDATTRDQLKKGGGRHGAQWMERRVARALDAKRFGDGTVNGGHWWWSDDVPMVNVVKHVPGYTILDNVIIHNGSVYLVTDDKASLPPLQSMIETKSKGLGGWQALDREEALSRFGEYGGMIKGVTWMSVNPPSNTTLFDLWRMYSTLDTQIDAQGRSSLPAPQRIVFPLIPFFADTDPPVAEHLRRRKRSETGIHPYTVKAAFPYTDMQYQQDWEDYHKMEVPFVIERLVVSDQSAAARSLNKGQPANAPPFGVEASRFWWEPVRRTLVAYFDRLDEEAKDLENSDSSSWSWKPKSKKVIVFIDNQAEAVKSGQSALLPEDHDYFSRSLNKLGRDKGYEVHTITPDTPWKARMDVMIRSTIVVGNHGDHLFDAMWMRPSPQTTLMEFFPENSFSRERELVMRSLGINYIAWWTNRHFTKDALPEVVTGNNQPVHINTDAIINEIHAVLLAKHR